MVVASATGSAAVVVGLLVDAPAVVDCNVEMAARVARRERAFAGRKSFVAPFEEVVVVKPSHMAAVVGSLPWCDTEGGRNVRLEPEEGRPGLWDTAVTSTGWAVGKWILQGL